jgi:hypothetical protein
MAPLSNYSFIFHMYLVVMKKRFIRVSLARA